jgi:hypothetical protein
MSFNYYSVKNINKLFATEIFLSWKIFTFLTFQMLYMHANQIIRCPASIPSFLWQSSWTRRNVWYTHYALPSSPLSNLSCTIVRTFEEDMWWWLHPSTIPCTKIGICWFRIGINFEWECSWCRIGICRSKVSICGHGHGQYH